MKVVEAKKFRAYTDDLLKQAKVETYLDAKSDSEGSGKSGTPAPAAGSAPSGNSGGM